MFETMVHLTYSQRKLALECENCVYLLKVNRLRPAYSRVTALSFLGKMADGPSWAPRQWH